MPARGGRLARLRADRDLLAREFPYLHYGLDEVNAVGIARGAAPIALPDGDIEPIHIEIQFGPWYPKRLPLVFETGGRFTSDPDRHVVDESRFCLSLRGIDEPDLRYPENLSTFMRDVMCFIEQQLIYERIKRFPGPQWPHTAAEAYSLHVVEQFAALPPDAAAAVWEAVRGVPPGRNAPCPCGSGRKYKRCHLGLVEDMTRLASANGLSRYGYDDIQRHARLAA